jgi:hypothetical protein
MRVVDCVDREVKVGCTVLYAVRRGSSMWLKRMTVLQIVEGGPNGRPYLSGTTPEGRRVSVRNLDTVAVIVPLGVQYETTT